MTRAHLHGLAALLLIGGGALFIFTETVAPAVAGLGCTVAAGVLLIVARYRETSK
jgi:membrane-bound ClpP family serine protease